jgi:type IV pilus assembly protein PilB
MQAVSTQLRKPLGELLLDRGYLRPEQLQRALEEQRASGGRKLLGEVLIGMKLLGEDQIAEVLAQSYGVPFAKISPRLADPKVIPILPREFLLKHTVLPLFLVENVLTVAVAEPTDLFLQEELARVSGKAVQIVAGTARDIRATLETYLPNDQIFVIDEIIEEVRPEEFALVEKQKEDITSLEAAAKDSPVVKIVNYCIYTAVKEGASDIHIEPDDGSFRVRFRIDGALVERLRPPYQMHAAVASRIKIMAGLDIAERRLPQDGGIHVVMDKRPIDLRVSTMPGKAGEKVVIRVIDNDKSGVNLEKLGFGYDTLKTWRRLIAQPNGILLVTGPTGSGKSSTLYASVAELNNEDTNICTVEDPVEYKLPGVNQSQVNEKAGFTFASALRSLLRQDPDVIMVGEVRDQETARLATQASLTGHLVFSTLHTNDAASAITRLINLGVEPYLVAATVGGVLAQRLVRKLCPHCKLPQQPSAVDAKQIEKVTGKPTDQVFKAKGCEKCRNMGYSGRIGIYELFVPDERIVELISQNAPLNDIRKLAVDAGMVTLRADGLSKVAAGVTTLDEVFRATT